MEDIYRQLQKHLDNAPVGYPATKSGVEIRLLKHFFTEEEAKIALNLSLLAEPVTKIYKRFKKREISIDNLEISLNTMAEKGSILARRKSKKESTRVYSRIPLAIGMFEFQVDRVTKGLAEDFFTYEDEAFADEMAGAKTKQMRTIPLNVKIDPQFHIGNYDKITDIIKNSHGPFAVMNCVCRQAKDTMDEPCKQTDVRETCLMLENSARHMMERGVARELTREEMLKMITRAKKEGMVLQPENNQKPNFICCCCGCCCGVLKAAKKFEKPAEFLHSNFYAEIKAEKCDACEDCQNICQMEAIDRVNGYMEVNIDRCIGCGLCIPVCSTNTHDMYKKIMYEKFGLLGTLKVVAKAALGQKV
jgi:Pyruvate/2-oxoacid:ferredoxin oxidoreductase delta subunit